MDALLRDLKFSVRSLAKNRAFSVIAILTLSVGIGSTTAIFSVVNAVVLTPLPYPDAEELVHIRTAMTDGRSTTGGISPFAQDRLNEQSSSFDGFSGAFRMEIAIRDMEDRPLKTAAYIVTPGYFDVFAEPMAIGRGFLEQEHLDFAPSFVVLSHRLWAGAYNADPSIVGAAIPAGPGSLTVVGVASPDFDYPVGADLWLAARPQQAGVQYTGFYLDGIGRLSDGVTVEQGQVKLDLFAPRFAEESGSFQNRVMPIQDLQASIVGDTSTTLLILLGAAATLLLIACANVMNLLLSRGETRTREVALRAALGASSWRLIGQLLTESMTLAGVGAILGLTGTWLSLRVLAAVGPGELPRMAEIQIDGSVLLFTVCSTALTGLVFGMLPAIRLVATDIKSLMGGSSRGSSGGRGGARVFDVLVLAQTGLAVTLVIGAGLLVRSFQRLQSADAGFSPESVLVIDVNFPQDLYPDIRAVGVIYEQALAEIAELPGVTAVGAASTLPLGEQLDFMISLNVEGIENPDGPERVRHRQVAPGFFEALGIELKEGRSLQLQDREDVGGGCCGQPGPGRLGHGRSAAVGPANHLHLRGLPGLPGRTRRCVGDVSQDRVRDRRCRRRRAVLRRGHRRRTERLLLTEPVRLSQDVGDRPGRRP